VVIDALSPLVAGGAFAAKRVAGEVLLVEADAFSDGHDALGVELQWRWAGEEVWRGERMAALGNDRWSGALPLDRIGRAAWRIEAWIDRFAGARSDLEKRIAAGVAGPMDLEEAVRLVEAAAEGLGSGRTDLSLRKGLRALGKALRRAAPEEVKALLLAPETAALMSRADTRPFAARSAEQAVETDRLRARFASWYELFPRSQAREAGRHGDFDDVIERLPAIRDMGFDVVYFPPIHPIGLSHRKGPDNSLTAGPGDPGSPYAIGSPEGGHDAVHPDLGGLAAFRRLMAAATALGLEVALDFAIQCSPDHPWLTSRPGWFAWRPDGSLRCAENPPKRYEDIVNVDFYAAEAVPALWAALRDVVLFWIGEGVRTFRVDNPHTKPLPFWRWMIADVRARHPETLFLSEAFTRPKMMYRLAKEGFSQSYTYFTWRERKEELEAYLLELADGPPREFFRPHFFVNTPDINPSFLQRSGRAGFLIRAALAATLSGLFGVYSGFELLEADPIPGKEEYLHSEKFELRQRDWTGEPNIIAEISLLNRLRRANPALQTHLGVAFHPAANDNVLFFSKGAPGADLVLVAISLNPHGAEACDVEVPLWRLGLEGDAAVGAIDLVTEETFVWRGARQWLRLEPERPFALWRLAGEVAR
jgi:starch synthase (maltosyl-transferring)